MHEPLGVVLVVAPWNYPVQLSLAPAVGALAAGNCVVIKPSELAPETSGALAALATEHLDSDAVAVLEGGPEVVHAALDSGVDHVLFSGGESTGRLVMQAAARTLTPVTLELGGKNPAIVVADADIPVAARRIAWGRYLNAGQTCVSPDYVLVERRVAERFVGALKAAINEFYGSDPVSSPDFARIVNDRHFTRLAGLLASHGGEVVLGGATDPATRFIAPTVVRNPSWDSPLMAEEIFGPILAVVDVDDLEDAFRLIATRARSARALHLLLEAAHGARGHSSDPFGRSLRQRDHAADRRAAAAFRRYRSLRDGRLPRQGGIRTVEPSPRRARSSTARRRACPVSAISAGEDPLAAARRAVVQAEQLSSRRRARRCRD